MVVTCRKCRMLVCDDAWRLLFFLTSEEGDGNCQEMPQNVGKCRKIQGAVNHEVHIVNRNTGIWEAECAWFTVCTSRLSTTNAGSMGANFCFGGKDDRQRTLVIRITAITLASDSAITIARDFTYLSSWECLVDFAREVLRRYLVVRAL